MSFYKNIKISEFLCAVEEASFMCDLDSLFAVI